MSNLLKIKRSLAHYGTNWRIPWRNLLQKTVFPNENQRFLILNESQNTGPSQYLKTSTSTYITPTGSARIANGVMPTSWKESAISTVGSTTMAKASSGRSNLKSSVVSSVMYAIAAIDNSKSPRHGGRKLLRSEGYHYVQVVTGGLILSSVVTGSGTIVTGGTTVTLPTTGDAGRHVGTR